MPVVKETRDWVGLQPGVEHDGRGVRQSTMFTYNERTPGWGDQFGPNMAPISYTVDGVRMVNNDARAVNLFTGVNRSSVQEISVVTGVPEAEYGNMDAGLINIVTKQGGQNFHGFLEYRYTLPGQRHFGFSAYDPRVHLDQATGKSRIGNYFGRFAGDPRANWFAERENIGPDGIPGTEDDTGRLVHVQPDDYTDVAGHLLEASVSGPLHRRVTFHASIQTDRKPAVRPFPALRSEPNYQVTGKLTFDLTQNIDLKVGGVLGWRDEFRGAGAALSTGQNIFLPAGQSGAGREKILDGMVYAVMTHALSPRTFYELRISRSDSKRDTAGMPLDTQSSTLAGLRDADDWFLAHRNVRDFRLDRQTRYSLKLDFASQVKKSNFVKLGIDLTRLSTWEWGQDSRGTPGSYDVWTLYDYYEAAKRLYGDDGQMDFVPTLDPVSDLPKWSAAGNLDDPAWNGFRDFPRKWIQVAAYIQDKVEFQGMVINMGLRLDGIVHNGKSRHESVWNAMPQHQYFSNWMQNVRRGTQKPYPGDPQAFPLWDGPNRWRISPRFGVSHPFSEKVALHFSYGKFFLQPIAYQFYGQSWRTGSGLKIHEDLNNDGRLSSYEYYGGLAKENASGTTNLRPPTTASYEAGLDWNLVSDYKFTGTYFYRRSDDYPGSQGMTFYLPDARRDELANMYVNRYSAESRGLELAVSKRFSHFFSFNASYTWYWENNVFYGQGNTIRDYGASRFFQADKYRYKFQIDPGTGERVYQPLTAAEIQSFGQLSNQQIQGQLNTVFGFRVPEEFADNEFRRRRDAGVVGLPLSGERDIGVRSWNDTITGIAGPQDRRDAPGEGSVTAIFATPADFGPAWGRFRPLGDLNVNLVLRVDQGTFFRYVPNIPSPSTNELYTNQTILATGPTAFTTDLGVQKTFSAGGLRPTVFFEATNLFNKKNLSPQSFFTTNNETPKYGLMPGKPNPSVVRNTGQVWDEYSTFQNRAREIYFGVRFSL